MKEILTVNKLIVLLDVYRGIQLNHKNEKNIIESLIKLKLLKTDFDVYDRVSVTEEGVRIIKNSLKLTNHPNVILL